MLSMNGTTQKGEDSPPGRARSPLGCARLEGRESGEEVLDRTEALGPPPLTPSASREKSEEAYLPVLEYLSGLNDYALQQQGEEENEDSDKEKDEEDDAILSEDSMDSVIVGIVDRCKKEEDSFIKAKRPVRCSVKRRAEANLDTTRKKRERLRRS